MLDGYEFSNSNTSYYMEYGYNYQGVRVKKAHRTKLFGEDIIYVTVYYMDGSRIIGEDLLVAASSNSIKIRYFYDAEGIAGVRYKNKNYNFLRDALGSVRKVLDAWASFVCVYRKKYNKKQSPIDNNF